ncbi:hypothetical protein AAGW05_00540 [Arthrobacter sp. LAPM80]|uniref:hypothetical protein n=1 Tax=Arthrobacter sp. LAPM80 TaxID=3141788 RepID=UPI00398B255E
MRWELLFGDLEAQLHAATQQDLERQINELARVEASQLTLAEVLRGAVGSRLSVVMRNGTAFHGEMRKVEPQWVLLHEDGRSVLLPLAKILRMQGTGQGRAGAPSKISFTLAAALRILTRNRSSVVIELDSGRPSIVRGVLDQVGADYVQLMQLADGVSRDRGNTQGSIVVPIEALVSIASSPDNEF